MAAVTKYCLLIYLFLWVASIRVSAQVAGSLHLQSENNQPFTVQWKGMAYESSRTGYLVIPHVPAGNNSVLFGFPGGVLYVFNFSLAGRPRAFSIKLGIDNSWSLFDMVSYEVVQGNLASRIQLIELAGAQAIPILAEPTNTPGGGRELVKASSRIKKIFNKATASGIDQVYVVFNGMKADTVALFIPVLDIPQPPAAAHFPPLPDKAGFDAGLSGLLRATAYKNFLKINAHDTVLPGTGL